MSIKVAILGFGTVGSSVARILCDLKPQGVELTHIFNRSVARKRAEWVPSTVTWTESFDEVLASDANVIVELVGGLDPAGEWVRRALEAGKSAVTGNKKLIAQHGVELDRIARAHGASLFYGAAVAGGIPVIPGLQHGLAGDQVTRLEGILNGTCNYILSRMEEGAQFADVLKDAQSLGYAEANPSEDVDGYDARAKLVILSRIALRADLAVEDIPVRTITSIAAIDFEYAGELSCTIRQISRAETRGGALLATVGPMLVPKNSPLAWSRGTENMVLVGGKYGGDVVFSGHGAGGHPTAVAVVSDLITLAHGSGNIDLPSRKAEVSGEFLLRHYIRFVVKDRPGIVGEIAGALAGEQINIHALFQRPGFGKDSLPFVVTVEPCTNSALKRALAKISSAEWLAEPPLDLQILEPEEPLK
ncbi:homoserine dehydrogenase [Paracidobacterium acidisoli]|uniref:Homoserine dehydrogenase n=1 Tax=Paracidobacterium acidisoli TaxID=2303751 RepID=A0A372IUF0_9BACT|nr:homoserine dehydrogenase [Paracidobacterium acidisoli]MBT9329888.1 homoserine dehydrogenase [Paracidobacterium acidisoli]